MRKSIAALAATAALAAPIAAMAAPAQADDRAHTDRTAKVVFKAWGDDPRAMVGILGKGSSSIDLVRPLPFKKVMYLSGLDLDFAMISVEDTSGYDTVGCSIKVNGRLVARDVADYGYALCTN